MILKHKGVAVVCILLVMVHIQLVITTDFNNNVRLRRNEGLRNKHKAGDVADGGDKTSSDVRKLMGGGFRRDNWGYSTGLRIMSRPQQMDGQLGGSKQIRHKLITNKQWQTEVKLIAGLFGLDNGYVAIATSLKMLPEGSYNFSMPNERLSANI